MSGPGPDQSARCPSHATWRGRDASAPPDVLALARAAPRASSRVRRTRSMPLSAPTASGGSARGSAAPGPSSRRSLGHSITSEIRPRRRRACRSRFVRASQSPGMSSATAAVTKTCSADSATLASACRRARVQFGEHVVEQQHRIAAVGTQQLVGRQPQRQRHRPRLPVAGKAFRGLVAEPQLQIVAVRAHQTDAALEFRGPRRRASASSNAASKSSGVDGARGRLVLDGLDTAAVPDRRRPRRRRQQLVGLLHLGRELRSPAPPARRSVAHRARPGGRPTRRGCPARSESPR